MAAFKWLAAWLKGADITDCEPESAKKPKIKPASSPEPTVCPKETDESANPSPGDGTSESDSGPGLADHER